ncbi:hypothetical protein CEXT_318091 [Caerostris extrusa]|uniref:Uncharacterized protein n=1 Tax=Caerostris extrusa TaxID=172846 RepID=A0AAV4PKF8_CAEEX|nr:hypothetical protein CEXT_318091 [Caerostris extrusa]
MIRKLHISTPTLVSHRCYVIKTGRQPSQSEKEDSVKFKEKIAGLCRQNKINLQTRSIFRKGSFLQSFCQSKVYQSVHWLG